MSQQGASGLSVGQEQRKAGGSGFPANYKIAVISPLLPMWVILGETGSIELSLERSSAGACGVGPHPRSHKHHPDSRLSHPKKENAHTEKISRSWDQGLGDRKLVPCMFPPLST